MKQLIFLLCLFLPYFAFSEELLLKDNLRRAKPGDYIVASRDKMNVVLLIRDKTGEMMTLEEITVSSSQLESDTISWKDWIESNGPGNSSWVVFQADLTTGELLHFYSYTNRQWYQVPSNENFFSTLINLRLHPVPAKNRKKVGSSPSRYWQPQMVFNGERIDGVTFIPYETHWPKDESELSGKTIEVYLPESSLGYPSYFPYWLQIRGIIGKAKVWIVDSGSGVKSPKMLPK
jgi:hypothetical protein